jgi:hypothetical protein
MMHPHLQSPRQLAVPGIGFSQSISVGPNVSYLEALRKPTPCRETDDHHDAPMRLVDCIVLRSASWPWSSPRW